MVGYIQKESDTSVTAVVATVVAVILVAKPRIQIVKDNKILGKIPLEVSNLSF